MIKSTARRIFVAKSFLVVQLLSLCTNKAFGFSQQRQQGVLSSKSFIQLQAQLQQHDNDKDDNNNNDIVNIAKDRRRQAIFSIFGTAATMAASSSTLLLSSIQPAFAEYGADAKMQLPDMLGAITDRATKQCLVESLGNRECLVYMEDQDKLLYKGVDGQVLLERIEKSSAALAKIPLLVESKKWTSITGVLTGPMGTLNETMKLLLTASRNPKESETLAKQVRSDVYAIGAAVERKQSDAILKAHEAATNDLVKFVKSL